ncbi:transporter substrate-binding domain-containing protein [Actinomadura sp. LD22]|uniref:Transporter substrate-binding domain-containing protein n=1 Tax=Actinomadura physcomitrii TaxID=2650748 RepID=A0A6I4M7T2_9ACTN|nr:transporter substrate-binding domain-containing protein [Actinomadura physcomitrii]MVZ98798.1 transporter substrate-binding domain-containing protein [Actinomadura physcomitrii]
MNKAFGVRFAAGGAVAAAALTLAGCGGGSGTDGKYGLEESGTVLAAVSTDQPPFATADKGGKPQGFIIDLTDEVAKRLKLKVQYKASTVPAALQGLSSGQYDLAASGLGVTAERQKQVSFTKGVYWSTTTVLTRKDSTATKLTDFSGKRVGDITGAVQQEFVKSKMPGAKQVQFQNQNSAVSQLLSGNLDAFVVGGPDADAYLKKYGTLKPAVSAPVDHPTAMAVQKKNTKFQQAFDAQLGAMVQDGTFLKIYKKWFVEAPRPELVKIWPALGSQTGGNGQAAAGAQDGGNGQGGSSS